MAWFKMFLCHDWLMFSSPLSLYSPLSRFGGTTTVISTLNVLLSYGSNNHLFRLGIFCHTQQLEFWVCRSSDYHVDFVSDRFPIGGPA